MLNQHQWGRLQKAFATGSPVIALGPGCHRIGYDAGSESWERVVERMRMIWTELDGEQREFVRQFWESKLSDEQRNWVGDEPPPEHDIAVTMVTPLRQRARVTLAITLLKALVECTEALGKVIASGQTPVGDWLDVSLPRAWPKEQPAKAVEKAKAVAKALAEGTPEHEGTLAEHGVTGATIDPDEFRLLKIGEVSTSLTRLYQRCFVVHEVSLSGALVEWLADVLWHIVISGSGVPLSQDELAFYVNLTNDALVTEEGVGFNRPRPGDYRHEDRDGIALTADIQALLACSEPNLSAPDWTQPRERFAATMAASVVASWRQNLKEKGHPRLAIALVADYDVLLERAILQALSVGEHLHTVMPAWVTRQGERRMEWVIASLERSAEKVTAEMVTEPKSWRWFEPHTGFFPELEKNAVGPIVVKLSGSPLHLSSDAVAASQFEFDERLGYEDATLAVATIFSEHDSMEAMLSFAETANTTETLPHRVFDAATGLDWQQRTWLFFGHRFSDWLPRLRLFFAANEMGRPRSKMRGKERVDKIAVDRGFDHPERALLAALEINPYVENLGNVGNYFGQPTNLYSTNARIRAFCDAVESCLEQSFRIRGAG